MPERAIARSGRPRRFVRARPCSLDLDAPSLRIRRVELAAPQALRHRRIAIGEQS